jgi:hypothetical protein
MRSNPTPHRSVLRGTLLSVVMALAPVAAGCGDIVADRCDEICSCENCGEREYEECEIKVAGELDIAAAYDCFEELELYYECQLEEYECNGREYDDDNRSCLRERDDFESCKRAESRREGGPY